MILLAAAFTGVATVGAKSLSPEEALARVQGAMSRSAAPVHVYSAKAEKAQQPALYVFNNGGIDDGYMVLSADDAITPVLGYSDSGSFNPMQIPDNMRWWLDSYAAQIAYAAEHSADVSYAPVAKTLTAAAPREAIKPLCTTKWNQDAPFNNLCPLISGKRTYTGCVATSMAQAMKYHNYPERGTGTGTVNVGADSYTMNFANTVFEWDKMSDTYAPGKYTAAQGTAVATLMKAAGYSVKMAYGTSASGAYSIDIAGALVNKFNYDAGANYYMRMFYTLSEWEQMLYNNLKECGPIIYGGNSYSGGHSFICDGYHDGYFHFNWGWGGMSDGYFLLSALDPGSQGIGGSDSAFNYDQDAVLGIRKPVSGSSQESKAEAQIGIYGKLNATLSGSVLTVDNLSNVGICSFTGTMGLRLVNQANSEVKYARGYDIKDFGSGLYYESFPMPLPTSIADGTYKVYPVYSEGSGWKNVLIGEGSPKYVTVVRSGSKYTLQTEEEKRFEVTDISLGTKLYAGQAYTLTYTVSNPNSFSRSAEVSPIMLRNGVMVGYSTSNVITLDANETRTFTHTYTLLPASLMAGSCKLYMGEDEVEEDSDGKAQLVSYRISDNVSVYVRKNTSEPTVSVSGFTIDNASAVNAAELSGSYTVSVNGGYAGGALTMYIFDSNSQFCAQIILPAFSLNAGESKDFTFTDVFGDGQPGKRYVAVCYLNSKQVTEPVWFTVDSFVGVEDIQISGEPVETEYYNMQGIRVSAENLTSGIYVVINRMADGKVNTSKMVVR